MSSIRERMAGLLTPLSADVFEFEDQSHLHAGHAGNRGGGHYAVLLVSSVFAGQNRINRQRTVQNLLAVLFDEGLIHALSIRALTPEEYFQ